MEALNLPNKFKKPRDLEKVLRMELLPKAKPPKFDERYSGRPLERGQAVCIVCHHSFVMRKGMYANNDTCGGYWCRFEYAKLDKNEIENRLIDIEQDQDISPVWECPNCKTTWNKTDRCNFCDKGGEI